jgi:hypothetical protein
MDLGSWLLEQISSTIRFIELENDPYIKLCFRVRLKAFRECLDSQNEITLSKMEFI